MKKFFDSLQQPLIPKALFGRCCAAADVGSRSVDEGALQHCLQTLAPPVLSVLHYVCKFLHAVSQQQQHNRMGAEGLSAIWGPIFMKHYGYVVMHISSLELTKYVMILF